MPWSRADASCTYERVSRPALSRTHKLSSAIRAAYRQSRSAASNPVTRARWLIAGIDQPLFLEHPEGLAQRGATDLGPAGRFRLPQLRTHGQDILKDQPPQAVVDLDACTPGCDMTGRDTPGSLSGKPVPSTVRTRAFPSGPGRQAVWSLLRVRECGYTYPCWPPRGCTR